MATNTSIQNGPQSHISNEDYRLLHQEHTDSPGMTNISSAHYGMIRKYNNLTNYADVFLF